mmetsp:Transcript_79799/g.97692  ORF Transcript_79799/g.97692 Transcript_79799/m.97692 type:complete len:195 (+) Transcript_79799:2-586(+)
MFAAAFKGAMSSRRLAVRVCQSIQSQEEEAEKEKNAALAAGYLSKVRLELQGICIQVLELVEGTLLPKAENGEPIVFYKKMQADYYRYLAEFLEKNGQQEAIASAIEVYADANAQAERHLMVTHPVRLGLALNYAVFQQVILKDTGAAIQTAKEAYVAAVRNLEGMPEEAVRDAHPLLAVLLDNLKVWAPDDFS